MKTFEISVTIYVQGETAGGALEHLADELDYICSCDNQLLAVSYPDANDISEENQE
jgi:hypothetical protein